MEAYTKRNKLTVINHTHLDFEEDEIPGLTFKLTWTRDVHEERAETPELRPEQEDTKKSRGIGNGGNTRHFDIEVKILWDNEEHPCGSFTHSIHAPAGSSGEHEKTWFRFDRETWMIYRTYFRVINDQIQEVRETIGPLPFKISEHDRNRSRQDS